MSRARRLLAASLVAAGCAAAACGPKSPIAAPAPFPSAPGTSSTAAPAAKSPVASKPRPAESARPVPPPLTIVTTALALRGTPYRLGGDEPTRGFDCSGLVRYVLSQHAIRAPRTVAEQFGLGHPVGSSDVQPGDLLFFTTVAPGASHVGIAISASEFVHAPSNGGVVRIDRLDAPYWHQRWIGARRLTVISSSAPESSAGAE